MTRPALLLAACCLLAGMSVEAAHDPTGTYVSLQLENDALASNSDRYYTHGTQVSLLQNTMPPVWLDTVADWVPFYEKGHQPGFVNYTVAQKVFTPYDTKATHLVADDRPYAGYLYFSAAVLSRIDSSDAVEHGNMFEITVGVVGPSALGEEVQRGLHNIMGIDTPQGWDQQLHDELALGLSYQRFWRVVQPTPSGLEFGIAPHLGMVIGNVYTYASGGVTFRLGEHLKRDLTPPSIPPGFPGMAYFRPQPAPSWYLFLGFESRLVARDIFLDGNTFRTSHSVDRELLVGDMQYGLVYIFDDIRLSYSHMLRTMEFSTQEVNTHYGAFNISFLLR